MSSALSQSYFEHAQKLINGQYGWIKTRNGYVHATREETKNKIKHLLREASYHR